MIDLTVLAPPQLATPNKSNGIMLFVLVILAVFIYKLLAVKSNNIE